MPWEYTALKDKEEPFHWCPSCHIEPFESFLRGLVHRRKRKYWLFGKERPYCAVICSVCKEIVAYEDASGNVEQV